MKSIYKKISLEPLITRFPVCFPSLSGNSIMYYDTYDTKYSNNAFYGLIPLGVNQILFANGFSEFTEEMDEKYSGVTLHCYELQKWMNFFREYFGTIRSVSCHGVYENMVDYANSVYPNGIMSEEALNLDSTFLEYGGESFYKWLIDNYFITLDFISEYESVSGSCDYVQWVSYIESIGTYYMTLPDVLRFTGKMSKWDSMYFINGDYVNCQYVDTCCDCVDYINMGGHIMFEFLKSWINRIKNNIEHNNNIVKSFGDDDIKKLIPNTYVNIPLIEKFEDLGVFVNFCKEFEPGNVYVSGNTCHYDGDVYILSSQTCNSMEFKESDGWVKYYTYKNHNSQFNFSSELSGRTVSNLEMLKRNEKTFDSLGNEMPGYFKPNSGSTFMQPSEGTTLEFMYEPGNYVNMEKKYDNDGNEIYVCDYLDKIELFYKDVNGNVIEDSFVEVHVGDSVNDKIEECKNLIANSNADFVEDEMILNANFYTYRKAFSTVISGHVEYEQNNTEFYYRQTSNGEITTEENIKGNITRIKGQTIAWNQLLYPLSGERTSGGVTYTYNSNGSITLNGTCTSRPDNKVQRWSTFKLILNHVYYISTSNNTYLVITNVGRLYPTITSSLSSPFIGTCVNAGSPYFRLDAIPNNTYTNFVVWPVCFDLTLIYGSGNEPSTPAQFEADYFKWFGKPLTYEAYDEGSLRNVQMEGIKTTFTNANPQTRNFDVTSITGKLNGEGESVVIFPDGMKGVNDVKDEIYIEDGVTKAVKRIGRVDLGSLRWAYYSVGTNNPLGRFCSVGISSLVKRPSSGSNGNILCSKYATGSRTVDKSITLAPYTSHGNVNITDSSYTTATTFKAAMQGVYLDYELAEPQVYILDTQLPIDYNCEAGGTEQILPEEIGTGIAPIMDITYEYDNPSSLSTLNKIYSVKCVDRCTIEKSNCDYYISPNEFYPLNYYKLNLDIENVYSEEQGGNIDVAMCDIFFDIGNYQHKYIESPLLRIDELLPFYEVENNDKNIYIDRGYATALDRHLRMSEINDITQLEKYGNGMFEMFDSNE